MTDAQQDVGFDNDRTNLTPGFDDYVTDANETFRTCLEALSRPGMILPVRSSLSAPPPLLPAAAALLLTLADYEIGVWLDDPLTSNPAVWNYIRFHTGAKPASSHSSADFAVISDVAQMPSLNAFDLGTPEFPDRSTTLIVQVEQLTQSGMTLQGPGIDGEIKFSVSPSPDTLAEQLKDNRNLFPRGVDIVFATPSHIAALPRSVIVMSEV